MLHNKYAHNEIYLMLIRELCATCAQNDPKVKTIEPQTASGGKNEIIHKKVFHKIIIF